MEAGPFILKTEDTIKANGRTIKCMVLENFITRLIKSPMKDTGKTINSMDKEEFITAIQLFLMDSSTIKIFHNYKTSGHTTKGNSKTIQSTARVILD